MRAESPSDNTAVLLLTLSLQHRLRLITTALSPPTPSPPHPGPLQASNSPEHSLPSSGCVAQKITPLSAAPSLARPLSKHLGTGDVHDDKASLRLSIVWDNNHNIRFLWSDAPCLYLPLPLQSTHS